MKTHTIYWLINQTKTKTYVGFTNELNRRIAEHRAGKIRTTRDFGEFQYLVLELVDSLEKARTREVYWKSAVGRKKLKVMFEKRIVASSSSG